MLAPTPLDTPTARTAPIRRTLRRAGHRARVRIVAALGGTGRIVVAATELPEPDTLAACARHAHPLVLAVELPTGAAVSTTTSRPVRRWVPPETS